MRVVVVGLGPAGADHVLPVARAALEAIPVRFARTARHPAVDDLIAQGFAFTALDAHYDDAATLDDAYAAIVDALVRASKDHSEIVYAVPGNPVIAERTVELLRAAGVTVEVVPGLSFAELAWARLAIDPMAGGARVVDGRAFSVAAAPLLIAQCDSRFVLSDVKLALLDALPPDQPVTVLQRLGRRDESVATLALADLDSVVEPDHLTSVFVDARGAGASMATADVAAAMVRFVELVERLRGPGGCPWDAEQTHHSLTRHLLEESYEVVEAIEALPEWAPGPAPAGLVAALGADDYAHLEEELGDLLFQVVFHTTLAGETGAFTMADVANGIHDKLVHRHPHVFGDVEVDDADHVVRNWEQIKRAEKGRASLMDGIPGSLPALLYVHKVLRKAAAAGLVDGGLALAAPGVGDATTSEREIGELLATTVARARAAGVDAEVALRGWAAEFRRHFTAMEELAAARGIDLEHVDRAIVDTLWSESRA
jgi:tetrapyrrole methylase family protein/MazG family protein